MIDYKRNVKGRYVFVTRKWERIFKCKWSLSGFLKDWTNSFVVCQLALILMNILFVIPWAVQFLSVDLPKRRKERADKIAAQTSGSFSADWRKRRERQKDLVRNARTYYSEVETLLYKKERKSEITYFFMAIKNACFYRLYLFVEWNIECCKLEVTIAALIIQRSARYNVQIFTTT